MTENNIAINVLIVDDRPDKIVALESMLHNMNLNIVTANSGADALRRLLADEFAVVLLDVNMPVMDGFETAKMIRMRPRSEHLPIIFITSERIEQQELLEGYSLGAVDYIIVPILPAILRAKVMVFADLFRLRQQDVIQMRKILEINQIIEQKNLELRSFNKTLQDFNATLEQRVAEEVARGLEKDAVLIHQSRMAEMGEMIANIAHQWRQPLNALALILENVKDAEKFNQLTPEYLTKQTIEGLGLIKKMSTTIDDFRNFFRPDKEPVLFCLNTPINASVKLIEASLKAHGIEVTTVIDEEMWTLGVANEYSQVILNLLNNAKDAILAHEISAGQIKVRLDKEGDWARATITDNGGGIADETMPHLFEPYITTKTGGTGIGLYMSKMIIENSMRGQLLATNVDGGAEFTVLTPLATAPDEPLSSA